MKQGDAQGETLERGKVWEQIDHIATDTHTTNILSRTPNTGWGNDRQGYNEAQICCSQNKTQPSQLSDQSAGCVAAANHAAPWKAGSSQLQSRKEGSPVKTLEMMEEACNENFSNFSHLICLEVNKDMHWKLF